MKCLQIHLRSKRFVVPSCESSCLVALMAVCAGAVFVQQLNANTELGQDRAVFFVVDVFVEVDDPEEKVVAVGGLPQDGGYPAHPLSFETTLPEFYQHPYCTDNPPGRALRLAFPEATWDTFVTIGLTTYQPLPGPPLPADRVVMTPTWPGLVGNPIVILEDAWGVIPDCDAACRAGNFEDNRVLIARLTVDRTGVDSGCISGTLGVILIVASEIYGDDDWVFDQEFELCFDDDGVSNTR